MLYYSLRDDFSSLIHPVLVPLFYCLIRHLLWDTESALVHILLALITHAVYILKLTSCN